MNSTTRPPLGSANSSGPDSSLLATLTSEASLMSSQRNLPAIPSATSSPGSADGASHSSLPAGQQTDLFGQDLAPASHSAAPASKLAQADERHLWPAFFRLIRECRPVAVFGEQVANAIGKGWLDGVSADLESEGYTCGAAVLGAHSVGAPHIRQRLYWVAQSESQGRPGMEPELQAGIGQRSRIGGDSAEGGLGNPEGGQRGLSILERGSRQEGAESGGAGEVSGLADPISQRGCRRDGQGGYADNAIPSGHVDWNRSQWIDCRDGRQRRVPLEPGFQPLAHGVPGRVGLLRGYGNAIVPQVAAAFIEAAVDLNPSQHSL